MNTAIQKGEFLEYGEHDSHIYGTRLSTIKEINKSGTISILDVEPNSLRVLRNKTYAPLVVYIAPGHSSNHNGYDVSYFVSNEWFSKRSIQISFVQSHAKYETFLFKPHPSEQRV